jgi:hypothetical protein
MSGLLTFAFCHRELPPNLLDISFCLTWSGGGATSGFYIAAGVDRRVSRKSGLRNLQHAPVGVRIDGITGDMTK